MANHKLTPGEVELRNYLGRGLTQRQIVDEWEQKSGIRVSRTAIAMAIDYYGLKSANPRPRYGDLLPWRVAKEHQGHYDQRMLRAEAHVRAGKELDHHVQVSLESWKRRLKEAGAVVHYDRNTDDGFHWVVPEDGDDDLIHYPDHHPKSPRYKAG